MNRWVASKSNIRILSKDFEESTDLNFENEKELWSTYHLEDGTALRVRHVLRDVRRLKRKDNFGHPIYIADFEAVISVKPKK